MFDKIGARVQYPQWVSACPRYRLLDMRDRLLDGTLYAHLRYAFYDEQETDGSLIKLEDRRPSAQYRLPRMVSRWCARKLFAGRHAPKLRHKDKATIKDVTALLRTGRFWMRMAEAVILGSVGAVACTFRVETGGGEPARVALELWRAKYCQPSFDAMGELAQLRVAYTTLGGWFTSMGATVDGEGKPIEAGQFYWYIRDWTPDQDITYLPVKKDDWNPVNGFTGENAPRLQLAPWAEQTVTHDLGFVTAHWFINLVGRSECPGVDKHDGAATWEDAIPNSIELDYTLSQIGRGTRYNCCPQLVTIGRIESGGEARGPTIHLALAAETTSEDQIKQGRGDAKLLEMDGHGTDAALKLIEHLRNMALEQIAASRKDPDKMKAPLSGRAMEYLDQDSDDLVMDLRTQYGDHGALPLIKKICQAAGVGAKAVGAMTLQWPRLFQPTPDEVFSLVQALALAVDPMKRSSPATPAKPAGASGSPAQAAQPAQAPGPDEQMMTMVEARMYLVQALDLTMMDLDPDADDDPGVDDSPTSPADPTPTVPPPAPIDVEPVVLEAPPEPGDGPDPMMAGNVHIDS